MSIFGWEIRSLVLPGPGQSESELILDVTEAMDRECLKNGRLRITEPVRGEDQRIDGVLVRVYTARLAQPVTLDATYGG